MEHAWLDPEAIGDTVTLAMKFGMPGTIVRKFAELGLPKGSVLLTFDDGPAGGGRTEGLLDVLREVGVPAVFCVVGRCVAGNEPLVRRIHADGHQIANHGHSHRVHGMMSDADFLEDIHECDRAVAGALNQERGGHEPTAWRSRFYRPPGGAWTPRLERLVQEGGKRLMPLTFFGWDMVPFPFREQLLLRWMLRSLRAQGGGVFLLHEAALPLTGLGEGWRERAGSAWVPGFVRRFVAEVRKEGYEFVGGLDG